MIETGCVFINFPNVIRLIAYYETNLTYLLYLILYFLLNFFSIAALFDDKE